MVPVRIKTWALLAWKTDSELQTPGQLQDHVINEAFNMQGRRQALLEGPVVCEACLQLKR